MRDHPDQLAEALAQLDSGAADLDKALEICPMLPEAHQLLGQIASVSALIAQRQDGEQTSERAKAYWHKAETHLEEAVKYKLEDIGEIYRMLSQVRVALGDLPGAEHAFTDAVRRDPYDMELWPPFLDFVLKFARFDQARNVLNAQIRELESTEPRNEEEKVKRDSALTTARLFLANIQENGYNDYGAALAAYQQAAAMQPERAEVWTNFARFAFQRGMVQQLDAAVLQAVADGGEQARETLPGAVLALDLYLRKGEAGLLDASSVLVAAARSYRGDDADLDANSALGWAVDFLQDAVQKLPIAENCLTVFNLGVCRNAMKQYERALGMLQVVDECIPQEQAAPYALHYADTLAGLGQHTEALAVLEKAVNIYPQDLELRWAMARNLIRVGEVERAKGIYDQLLQETGLDFQGRRMLEAERAQLK
jgi:tetratricopeptide (TPR) repeat protein